MEDTYSTFFETLFDRPQLAVPDAQIRSFVHGKTVVVTGGGGSIGSALCRQIAACAPRRLVILDIYENNAYAIQQELIADYGNSLDLHVCIASVRDYARIAHLFRRERPDIILHAAAHKHVPLMEDAPGEALKNNVFGTWNTAQAACESGAEHFILISTDKAVNPTNIMGATKRVCERIVQHFDATSPDTIFSLVRFGNVVGSSGSVIPLFAEQICHRRDLTVTDPRATRFFMTVAEATRLVLSAGAMAEGGEIFVLDMGEPICIDAIARRMIARAGLREGEDIHIRYTGLRPGEKLTEERLTDAPGLVPTVDPSIFVCRDEPLDVDAFLRGLDRLRELAACPDVSLAQIEAGLRAIVPDLRR